MGGLFGGGQSDGQQAQTAALRQASEAARAYRPEAMQARLNLLSKASNAYQGMNNAMETMYGGRSPRVGTGGMDSAPQNPHGLTGSGTFGGHPMPQQPAQQRMQGFDPMSILDPAGIFNRGQR